jgi:hypothetical protein
MQLNTFVQEYYQNPKDKPLIKRVGGMLPVSKNVFNDEIMHQKVDTAVNAIHIQQIASHLGIELEDVQHAAVEVCGMKQDARIFEKKVQDFESRENAYMNGSVLEKARRWMGSDPVDPRTTIKGNEQPVINIQLPEGLTGDNSLQERVARNEQTMQELSGQMASLLSALEAQFQAKQTEAETSKS